MTPTPEERAKQIVRYYNGDQTDYPCLDLAGWFVEPVNNAVASLDIVAAARAKIADAIRAAEAEASAWRPIETAPRDAKGILVCGGTICIPDLIYYSEYPIDSPLIVYWSERRQKWEVPNTETQEHHAHTVSPTHWQPLPSPPRKDGDS